VVRDPIARFYSSLYQAGLSREKEWTSDEVVITLEDMRSGKCGHDHHLETQASVLSTRIPSRGNLSHERIPLDFICRLESLRMDFELVLDLAQNKTGKILEKSKREELLERIATRKRKRPANSLSTSVDVLKGTQIDHLIREVWGQDIACFSPPRKKLDDNWRNASTGRNFGHGGKSRQFRQSFRI